MPAGLLFMFVFSGLRFPCLALSCLALLWWTETEVGGRVGWLAAGGGWAQKVCRGAVRGCDVRSCRGPGGPILATSAAARATNLAGASKFQLRATRSSIIRTPCTY